MGISESANELAIRFKTRRQDVIQLAQRSLQAAQEQQKRYYDRKRRDESLDIGEWGLLNSKNITIHHAVREQDNSCKKLVDRYIGPFKILKRLSDLVYRLELPESMQFMNGVFNVEQLE
ncbi:ac099402_4 22 kda kafirin cluster ty3-gypsy type [Plasmopara halstedii]|uniref:Ac099402_4 22 kDa kafirin cluster ty3-gypsy type n=1 Tax=Plasmopara halstedii TaxID=4781 RepID=A0A0P1AZE0_PLAHL|nr:ac099402_4 22 kda kafirin cluster ty3-gypsy type [Plasmopara halstedii]CEG47237.1 ac099402_4 22 kda kafirin cluster ty3-gypsy type [Plasmopara halstedii]|eukprot:XP_024583606.1 ac099402_4 22 kda kafirin cluster ty3-gypsy type [Plasmopara halstedii]